MSWISEDITFCNSITKIKLSDEIKHEVECPVKNTCHRFINQPKNHPWLSVFMDAPYDYENNMCEYFWKIDRTEKIKSRKKK
jgi:hypothetical protein